MATVPPPIASFGNAKYSEPRDILVGVYDETQGSSSGMARIKAMDEFTGVRTRVVVQFSNLASKEIAGQGATIVTAGFIPMFTCEFWLDVIVGARGVVPGHCAKLTSGAYDAQIIAYATAVAKCGRCFVRFAHEMNGNWYPWAGDPAGYLAAWKHFRAILKQYAPLAEMVFCVNSGDVGGIPAEAFYPGDGLVEWVAIDGYNRGSDSPEQVFEAMRLRVAAISSKPIAITEVGTPNGPGKSAWITEFFVYVGKKLYRMVCWYNSDKEMTWGLFGESGGDMTFKGYNCFASHAQAIVKLDPVYR